MAAAFISDASNHHLIIDDLKLRQFIRGSPHNKTWVRLLAHAHWRAFARSWHGYHASCKAAWVDTSRRYHLRVFSIQSYRRSLRGIDDHEFFETTGSVTIILVSPRRSRRRLADVLGVADLCQAGEGRSLRQRDLFERTTIPRADQGTVRETGKTATEWVKVWF